MAMEMVIQHHPGGDRPTIVIGFHSPEFSQCVYLSVSKNPLECEQMASAFYEQFLAACGAAVREFKDRKKS